MATKPKPFRILALDISTNPGFAVVEITQLKAGPRVKLTHVSSVQTDTDHTDAQRYAVIAAQTTIVLHRYGPFDAVVREHYTKGRNKRATQTVFGAWAAIDSALAAYGYVVDAEITPLTVKKAATGKGNASKEEVEDGVRQAFGLGADFTFKTDDESDAAAIALAYAKQRGLIKEDE
ncbi:crossover junction endodeoxyribonuclease RuvC [Psychrobacillus sp. MER TA 17]|nr:crossover junction endodeoxyribonuclease RuvC [Psychrobacillus sp. MER TA 17]